MSSDNKGPLINAITWMFSVLATIFLALRLYCKYTARRGLWWDDHILILSWVALIVSQILVSMIVALGTGRHEWDVPQENAIPMILQTNVVTSVSIFAAVWSKTSFALTLLRLMDSRPMKIFLWTIIGSMNIFMTLNAIFVWVKCSPPEKSWNYLIEGTCWPANVYPSYGMFAAGYSAAMDFVLALLPWKIIWGLRMKKAEKIGVAVAMSMGIFAGVTAIVKTVEIRSLAGPDITYNTTNLVIWGTSEAAVTIIAASIPVLRVLVRTIRSTNRKYYHNNNNDNVDNNANSGQGQELTHVSKHSKSQLSTVTITALRSTNHDRDQDHERELRNVHSSAPVGRVESERRPASTVMELAEPIAPEPAALRGIVRTNVVQVEYHNAALVGGRRVSGESNTRSEEQLILRND